MLGKFVLDTVQLLYGAAAEQGQSSTAAASHAAAVAANFELAKERLIDNNTALRLVQSVKPLLAPAAALAPLLQHWEQPEQAAADQLAVARAAAARSCAYLRCANLGGEGGPAAGEGVGSQRCR